MLTEKLGVGALHDPRTNSSDTFGGSSQGGAKIRNLQTIFLAEVQAIPNFLAEIQAMLLHFAVVS